MKKLFIAIGLAGISTLAMAQDKALKIGYTNVD